VIEARDFGLRLGGRPVLEHIDVDVAPGGVYAVVGERGSGKTTLLRALTGFWSARDTASGSLRVDGREIVGTGVEQRRALRRDGFVFLPASGRDALNPTRTVFDQLADIVGTVPAGLRNRSRRRAELEQIRETAATTLRSLGFADPDRVMSALPQELSGGMGKRVLLAMVLLTGARFVALDDPTGGLDVTIQRQILDLLDRLQVENGLTLVMATQNLGIAAHYASTVWVMEEGRVVETSERAAFFAEPQSVAGGQLVTRARAF
jgi:ABC-type glutathione transport system ATPase component